MNKTGKATAGDLRKLVRSFLRATERAGINTDGLKIESEVLHAPHTPKALPAGKMGVYVFIYNGQTLKVGRAGPNSQARWLSQHYGPGRACSTLAGSLLDKGSTIGVSGLSKTTVGPWIKRNCDRLNFIMDGSWGIDILTRLEEFLQLRLQPCFERASS